MTRSIQRIRCVIKASGDVIKCDEGQEDYFVAKAMRGRALRGADVYVNGELTHYELHDVPESPGRQIVKKSWV